MNYCIFYEVKPHISGSSYRISHLYVFLDLLFPPHTHLIWYYWIKDTWYISLESNNNNNFHYKKECKMSIDFQWVHWLLGSMVSVQSEQKVKSLSHWVSVHLCHHLTHKRHLTFRWVNFCFANIRFYHTQRLLCSGYLYIDCDWKKKTFTRKVPTSGLRKVLAFRCGCFYSCADCAKFSVLGGICIFPVARTIAHNQSPSQ